MYDYIKLTVRIDGDTELADILVAELAELGFDSFDDDGEQLNAYIPKQNFDSLEVEKLFDSDLFSPLTCTVDEIAFQNWNSVWESNFEPVVIDDKCIIHASFHKNLPDLPFKILINPKMTFGTGHHETTSLCVEALLGLELEGKSVLDMGCGTGVLGILAAMKHAAHVVAIDNDPIAVENARENITANGVQHTVMAMEREYVILWEQFDVVIANINRNVLSDEMPEYVKLLKDDGTLVISGFYDDDVNVLVECASALGLQKTQQTQRGKWVALMFKNSKHNV